MKQPYSTPVPNIIFDFYLRELNAIELKVLLIIIRQTLGWADRRGMFGRKEADWISGSQFIKKTGSSRRAISSAIDQLVKKGLIEVLDDYGTVFYDSKQRRGKFKLYYRLHVSLYKHVDKPVSLDPTSANFALDLSKKCTALVQKMHITKETHTK